MHHCIKNTRVDDDIVLGMSTYVVERILQNAENLYDQYQSINDTVGIVLGILVTSPLQTMFDVARQLPFENALQICDMLARIYQISQDDISQFLDTRKGCRGLTYARYMLSFVRMDSDNGGESYARARMILAGFVIPDVQVTLPNPFYNPARGDVPTIQNTKTLRVDFCWDMKKKDGTTARIVAELDGQSKYTDEDILEKSGATGESDVALKERDREGALTQMDMRIVRFQFFEASHNDGAQMVRKLQIAGVPTVSEGQIRRRRRWLRDYAQKHRMKLD
ncbi:hypothetical protein B9G54_06540 [Alloscardovia macacae]|uniref:Uncharacterized protein n=2 Tax=Alloscardovia macacae TaxID=1160091 RepID=A0A1Y2SWH4_9BIFI|nr:hypothetical protein B9G54_06540 [Alloscardovia macacae]OTA27944.1 hypothetical protein B9T39_07695 [Alloscardovia macacae]